MHRSVLGELVDVDVDDELVVEVVVEVVCVEDVDVVVSLNTKQSFQPAFVPEPSVYHVTTLVSKATI